MELNETLKELIEPVLAANGVILYEMKWLGNERTLQIAIMREDGSMDLDTCAVVSDALSTALDSYKGLDQAYTLEVCSPGAEREIRSLSELEHMEKPYVYLRLRHPVRGQLELTGEVQSFENSVITLKYRDKAAQRTAEIPQEDVEYIRLAVRI
ncbi:MAG: ribosome maturation factor RimP [Solobacterium sp.]|nr:ribosome maturation factor RimP [Solobacterium sp.]